MVACQLHVQQRCAAVLLVPVACIGGVALNEVQTLQQHCQTGILKRAISHCNPASHEPA